MKLRLKCLAISATTKGKGRRVVQIDDCITLFLCYKMLNLEKNDFMILAKAYSLT